MYSENKNTEDRSRGPCKPLVLFHYYTAYRSYSYKALNFGKKEAQKQSKQETSRWSKKQKYPFADFEFPSLCFFSILEVSPKVCNFSFT
ncbi:hypothetical protein ISN44_As01g059270 [Arabidopsis suecica]|uniref:Uncharacterized protein n=1 Tax=Arabidopsis suecica TaxID=45249 RepID=A0A8T2HKP0_ARASU|nr:hypothetical protein ISN44_As01g059270 [Arabidopsis suecica]